MERPVNVSLSGGKDSSAMLLMMLERGERVDNIIFADTGVEYPEIYEWLRILERHTLRYIDKIPPDHTWDEGFYRVIGKGRFAGQIVGFPRVVGPGCWFNSYKVRALNRVHRNDRAVVCLGIAADEAHRAERESYKETAGKVIYRFPLIEWGVTEADCREYLLAKGLVHPLEGRRSGCWMCPKQPKAALLWLRETHPDLWQRLLQYEADSPHGFKIDYTLQDLERDQATHELWVENLQRKN